MQIQEKKLRDIINQELKKIHGLSETDLVASDKSSWETKKYEFKNLVTNLLQNIEADDYNDASGEISKTISILKSWQSKIDKGLTDNSVQEAFRWKSKQKPFTAQDAIKSVLQTDTYVEYDHFVDAKSIDYTEIDGGFMLYFNLIIPGSQLDLDVLVAHNNVHSTDDDIAKSQEAVIKSDLGSTYEGENPGGTYKKVNVKYIGKNGEDYVFSISAKQGLDI